MSVGRDWNGGVYQKKDGSSWYVKLRRWEDRHKTDPWSKRKGFATKTKANACLRAAKDEYDLKERGMWNEARDGDIAPTAITAVIEAFEEHVRSGSTPRPRHDPEKHVKLIAARLRKAFEAMSVESLNDLKKPDNANTKTPSDKAATFLNAMLRNRAVIDKRCLKANEQSGGASIKTRNDYMATLKQFGRWLEETERLHRSPFAILRKIDGEPKQRQVLTWEQVRDLASAAIQRTLQSRARDANNGCDAWFPGWPAPAGDREPALVVDRQRHHHDRRGVREVEEHRVCAATRWAARAARWLAQTTGRRDGPQYPQHGPCRHR